MSVAILGSGSLGVELQKFLPHSTVFSRSDLDFLNQQSISDCVPRLLEFDTIINCIGVYQGDTKDILQVNFVSPVTLTEALIQSNYQGHLIMIGSHAATWPSWPGISHDRLVYANSKLALRNYIFGLSQSKLTNMTLSMIDLTKFKSNMSNYQGYDIDKTAKLVATVINQGIKVLHIEAY